MQKYLSHSSKINEDHYAMVGYVLRNTLSEYGHVSRGVCDVDKEMLLKKVTERTKIKKVENGATFVDADGTEYMLKGDEIVSMNLWGFHPSVFTHLQNQFDDFLKNRGHELKSELFIPSVVDKLIKSDRVSAKVLTTDDRWFGVTYNEDMLIARACIKELIECGKYPDKLWSK
jgi:hypothetical protein